MDRQINSSSVKPETVRRVLELSPGYESMPDGLTGMNAVAYLADQAEEAYESAPAVEVAPANLSLIGRLGRIAGNVPTYGSYRL